MRLLLVEDNEPLGSAIQKSLVNEGYAVDWLHSGKDVMASLTTYGHECVLLDLGLPNVSGEQLLARIREQQLPVSVIVITARGGIADRIHSLDLGADDYMVKPIDLDELAARVRAVFRRTQPKLTRTDVQVHGALELYPQSHTAKWRGKLVPLTNKEFWLLEILVRRKSDVLSRAQLGEALYGWDDDVDSNALEVYVYYLRRKFSPDLISTVRGVGYQIGRVGQDA